MREEGRGGLSPEQGATSLLYKSFSSYSPELSGVFAEQEDARGRPQVHGGDDGGRRPRRPVRVALVDAVPAGFLLPLDGGRGRLIVVVVVSLCDMWRYPAVYSSERGREGPSFLVPLLLSLDVVAIL